MMMENKIFSKEKDYLPAMYFMPLAFIPKTAIIIT
tara:strand:+ start:149 stop:253 length:105 start_codon:yes stop_codon:yes gene_type:complete